MPIRANMIRAMVDCQPPAPPGPPAEDSFRSLFDFLPIGAYRASPDGTLLRANPALVRLNGYEDEPTLLRALVERGNEWYVDPARRERFRERLERDGQVRAFVSEVRRHRTGERIW